MLTLAPILFDHLQQTIGKQLSFDAVAVQQTGSMLTRLGDATAIGLAGCAAFAGIISAAAIVAAVASGGWVNSLKPLMPET